MQQTKLLFIPPIDYLWTYKDVQVQKKVEITKKHTQNGVMSSKNTAQLYKLGKKSKLHVSILIVCNPQLPFNLTIPFSEWRFLKKLKKNTCSFLTILSIWSIFVWYIFGSILNDLKLRHIAQYHKLLESCLNSYLRNFICGLVNHIMSSNAQILLKRNLPNDKC